MTQSGLLAEQLEMTRQWTLNLIADLAGDDWTFQPGPGLGHALWTCGHLTTALDTLIHVRCLGQGVLDDAFRAHFPVGMPVRSAAEHDYPPVETVVARMGEIHRQACEAIRGLSDAVLAEPAPGKDGRPHPLFRDKRGAIAHANRHEAFHAGQIALIRRLLGRPFLR